MIKSISKLLLISLFFTSCVAVKEYEKINLSDPDMKLAERDLDKYKSTFQSYREAAAGANGGTTGGGCGCN
jgi:hypothetical protein